MSDALKKAKAKYRAKFCKIEIKHETKSYLDEYCKLYKLSIDQAVRKLLKPQIIKSEA